VPRSACCFGIAGRWPGNPVAAPSQAEREIKRDGDVIASVSKKWFRVRDSYGVEVEGGEDESLLLALTFALDEMGRR